MSRWPQYFAFTLFYLLFAGAGTTVLFLAWLAMISYLRGRRLKDNLNRFYVERYKAPAIGYCADCGEPVNEFESICDECVCKRVDQIKEHAVVDEAVRRTE